MSDTLTRAELGERTRLSNSVSNYIMPMSYDPDEGIFTLADLSVGAVFDVDPLAATALSASQLMARSESMARSLRNLFPHTLVQFLLIPQRTVAVDLDAYRDYGGEDEPILLRHRQGVSRHFADSIDRALFSISYGEGQFTTRRYRILACIVQRPDSLVAGATASLADFLRNLLKPFGLRTRSEIEPSQKRFHDLRRDLVKRLNDQCRRFESNMRAAHLPLHRLDAAGLLRVGAQMLAPRSVNPDAIFWDPTRPLAHQMVYNEVGIQADTGSMMIDQRVAKVVSMSGIPQHTTSGMLSMPNPDIAWACILDFLDEGILCLNGAIMPKDDMRRYIDRRRTKVAGGFAMQSRREILLRDCDLMSHYIENEKRSVLHVQGTFIIQGSDENDAQLRAEKFRDKLMAIGIDARVERHFAPSLFFQSLPFGFAPTMPEARRLHLMVDRTFADLLPIYLQSRGTTNAGALMHNRLGEPFRLNLFDAPGAAHGLVVGDSGSGKSFGMLYLLYSFLAKENAKAFYFDKGGSASMAATMLGQRASIHRMEASANATVINVCAGTYATTGAFLRSFIAHLASQSSVDRLDSDQLGILEEAIKAAFELKRRDTTYRTYQELLTRANDIWIHRARKRFLIDRLEQDQEMAVRHLRHRESGRSVTFEIYRVGYLHGRAIYDPETGEQVEYAQYDDARSVDTASRPWLSNRGVLIEDVIDPEGQTRAGVLYQNPSDIRTLANDGFDIEEDPELLILECERIEDLADLERAGVTVLLPEEWVALHRDRLRDELRVEYSDAPDDAIAEMVALRCRRLTGCDYWPDLDGQATVQEEVVLRDVIEQLRLHREQQSAARIIRRLAPYYGTGSASGFFDGKMGFNFDPLKMCVFELGELQAAGEHMVAAVVGALLQMIILYCQSEHLAGGGPRAYPKYIVLDEIWALIKVPLIRELLDTALRTMRKHRTSVIAISQFVREFVETPGGDIIVGSATFKILLKQPLTDIQQFDKWLGWPEEKINLMQTVHSSQPRGLYAEMLVDAPNLGICDVARFCADPYSYWLFTTDPDDLAERDRVVQSFRLRGFDQQEARSTALEQLASEKPNGMAAFKLATDAAATAASH